MIRLILALAILILPPPAAAEVYLVDRDTSIIEYEGTHDGNSFTGQFKNWRANILFDHDKLEDSSIFVEIDTASGETGNGFYDGTIKNKDWFDVKNYPNAQFTSKDIVKNEDGSFTANGSLTIKDITKPFSFNCTLSQPDETTVLAVSEFIIQRLDYAIGAKSDPDAKWVSNEITMRLTLNATPNSSLLAPKE